MKQNHIYKVSYYVICDEEKRTNIVTIPANSKADVEEYIYRTYGGKLITCNIILKGE